MPQPLLIIDDDERLAAMLVTYLSTRGFDVQVRFDGQSGLREASRRPYAAVILDVMLPDMEGFDVLRRLRANSSVPVLMLTARGDETDRIVGLEMGADDYLPKPFNPRELAARLKAVLRRGRSESTAEEILGFGALEIDIGAREVRVDGTARRLTSRQFDLLVVLARRAGRVQSREQLMEAVTGEELEAFDRSIDVHISRIRAAIEEDPGNPRWIRSVRGVGYVLVAGTESDAEP